MKKHSLVLFLFVFSFQLQAQKILFVGNSLTYTNDLPSILKKIAKIHKKNIETDMVCYPNYAIVDHLDQGVIQQKIATNNYDYVVIQQGPSSQEEGRKMLFDSGKVLSALCEKYNSKLVYYMVWPSKRYYFTFDKVIKNHTEAAQKNNALLFPVGKLWKQYETLKNGTSLYGPDLFHPSKTGSFLAAIAMFKQLFPDEDLNELSFKKVKKWVNKKSFKTILTLVN